MRWKSARRVAKLLDGRKDFMLEMQLASGRGRVLRALGRHREALAVVAPAQAAAAAAGVARYRLPLLVGGAESWRALGAADSVGAWLDVAQGIWEQERALPADPQWRERRGAEAQRLFALRVAQAMDGSDSVAAFDAVQLYKARTLLERILGPGEDLPTAGDAPRPVTLERLQCEILRPGEILLDAFVGPERGWLFAVTREACLVRPLPGEDGWNDVLTPLLAQLATPFEPYRRPRRGGPARHAPGCSGSSGRDCDARAATVFVCPDGVLHRVPFACCWRRPIPRSCLRRPCWRTCGRATRLRDDGVRRPARVLAVAGRENSGHRRLSGSSRRDRPPAAPVPARDRAGGGSVRHRPVRRRGSRLFDLLHLACHGEVDPQRPWNSALVFGTRANR